MIVGFLVSGSTKNVNIMQWNYVTSQVKIVTVLTVVPSMCGNNLTKFSTSLLLRDLKVHDIRHQFETKGEYKISTFLLIFYVGLLLKFCTQRRNKAENTPYSRLKDFNKDKKQK